MKTNYVLVDHENVQVMSLSLLTGEHFRVWIFLGPKNTCLKTDLVLGLQQLHGRLEFVRMETIGKNALDFHLAFYLGTLAQSDPSGFFHIISKDKGFDPLIQHLRTKQISAVRSESIETMPCFQPAGKKPNGTQPDSDETKLVDLVIADLKKRKTSKPSRLKTLLGTIRAVCGKELPDSKIESVFKALVRMSYVRVEGTRVEFKGL